jgi:uncharacterized membrane protein (DUF106 family)
MASSDTSSPSIGLPIAPLVLMMGFLLIASIESIRVLIGETFELILGPLIVFINAPFYIMIIVLSVITGLYASTLQKYMIDYDMMKRAQEKMKEFQKEYREAALAKDEKQLRKLENKRTAMMKDQMEMTQQQFKPMGYIMVITLPIFFWLYYRLDHFDTFITLPFTGTVNLSDPILFDVIPAWIIWYMLCSLVMSQVIRKGLDIGGL